MATRLRLPPLAILVLAFALFSLWAQWSKGIGMSLSPIQMAAMQPYALWQAMIGTALGLTLGFQAGEAFGGLRGISWRETRGMRAWALALTRLVPWVFASFLSIQGYDPVTVSAPWAVAAMKVLLPFTMAMDHSFFFGFAAGYFWGRNPQLGKHRDTPSV